MISMKKLRLSSHLRAKGGCRMPLGFARAQPCQGGSLHVRGTYHLHGKTWKFWLENQMVRTIPFGMPQKIWPVI